VNPEMKALPVTAGLDNADALRALEHMTVELHRLIRDGQGDADKTDELREQMVDIWDTLRPESRALLDNLSGDLYMLAGEEAFEEGGQRGQSLAHIKEAWANRDWSVLLSLLRHEDVRAAAPEDVRAYFRGRCWSSLGYFEAALSFYDHAARLAPQNDNYAYLALEALVRCGRMDEALERANAILRDNSASSRRLFKAADVLFHAARRFDEGMASIVYKHVLIVLERAFAREKSLPAERRLPSLIVGGHIVQGFCHEHMGETARAKQAYTEALALDPTSDAALTARGLLAYETDHPSALRDFERAATTGTPLVWPYLYLAYDALQSGEPARGLAMAREAKKRTQAPALLANLVEWEAIAAALQGGASAETIQLLQEAQAFNPFSDRISANLQAMIASEPAGAMRVANDTSPRDARERFSEELRLAA